MTTLKQRRDNFITFLDAKIPKWRYRVNRDELVMSDSDCCLAAQITGKTYGKAIEQLGLSRKQAFEYALFTGKEYGDYEDYSKFRRDYARYTRIWKEVL